MMLVSKRTLPALFIDCFAALFDSFLHRFGVLLRETSEGPGENGFALRLAEGFEASDEIRCYLKFFGRQRL